MSYINHNIMGAGAAHALNAHKTPVQDMELVDGVPQIVIGRDGQAYEVTLTQSWIGLNGAQVTSPASVAKDAFGDPADLGEGEFFITLNNTNFLKIFGKNQYLHQPR